MEKSLLVSFIGKAKNPDGVSYRKTKYEKTKYEFKDGYTYESTFFTVALYRYLKEREGLNPDLLVVGTTGSTWSELIQLVDESEKVFEISPELEKGFSYEGLQQLEKALSEALGVNVKLLAVEDEPPRVMEIAKAVFEVLKDLKHRSVILDITHSYRYMPFAVLSSFMIYKNLRNFSIRLFYGFLEGPQKQDGTRPAYELTDISQLLELSEAIHSLQNTGDFRKYYTLLGNKELAEEVYYKIETNQSPGKNLRKLLDFKPSEPYHIVHEEVNQILLPLDAKYNDQRMVRRAEFFAERGQYLKAIVLLYEAFIVLYCRKSGRTDCNKYTTREEILKSIRKTNEDIAFLSFLRNVIVHGTQPEKMYAGKIQAILGSEDELRKIFREYIDLYEKEAGSI